MPAPTIYDKLELLEYQVFAGDLRMLSLWQPWATCVAWHGKRPENRDNPRSVSPTLVDRLVAVHATATPAPSKLGEMRVCEEVSGTFNINLSPAELPRRAIVAVARVIGTIGPGVTFRSVPGSAEAIAAAVASRWYAGGPAYIFGGVVSLMRPVTCSGGQGLPRVPAEVRTILAREVVASFVVGELAGRPRPLALAGPAAAVGGLLVSRGLAVLDAGRLVLTDEGLRWGRRIRRARRPT